MNHRLTALVLATASLLPFAAANAGHFHHDCDVRLNSNYDLRIAADGLSFAPETGSGAKIRIDTGRLYVDGREVSVNAADHTRLMRFEDEVLGIREEAIGIALEGIELGLTAVREVNAAFEDDQDRIAAFNGRLDHIRVEMVKAVRSDLSHGRPTDEEIERVVDKVVEPLVKELVSSIAANVAGDAIAMALSGDESRANEIEAKAKRLERTIEDKVEGAAKKLEARAQDLCPRVQALAKLNADFEVEVVSGAKLDLM
ncbi:MAG: DUF2884 family protein [Rhodanobacteraceae bacterium]|nr:DUF2884 family protein [Rhodanobacteraceae bacterium]MBK7044183.1 DUF2884 family protein [Rhodanobacteraceae bacterium]MBP9154367.1 DUF2884 family protein [Xanthomonadales bacterium]HQW80713.1 DUF2884 family protein [Pseudomonadota bacterium]